MSFFSSFFDKPILGMIHLAGENPVKRAIEEIQLLEEERVDGAIIENYHGSEEDVINTLEELSKIKLNLKIGVNMLPNEFDYAFELARKYNANFIQVDYVAGRYEEGELDFSKYDKYRNMYSGILVLGGVWPKYYAPVKDSFIETDLKQGVNRCDAIVVTGEGTGKITPLEKIKKFKSIIKEHPLIIGAGLNSKNAYEQLSIADGAIVGSYFKNGNTNFPVDRMNVRELMCIVNTIRHVWSVYRQDDNGNKFLVKDKLNKSEADKLVQEFSKGHKQYYWVSE